MKGYFRALLAVTLLISGLGSLHAQKGIKLGIVALPQTSWMLNSDDMDAPQDVFKYKTTFGMAAGPSFGYNFTDGFGFRMNFMFSSQGQRYTNLNSLGTEVNHFRRISYFKVPLFLSFNTRTDYAKLIFSFNAGFQASLLTRAKYTNDDESYTPDEALLDNVTNYPTTYQRYTPFEYGPVVDLGLDIKLTYNMMANIHLRGDYSLTDAENKNSAYKLWTSGIPDDVRYYPESRGVTNNLTGGIMFGLTYTITSY
jgi:Outer membrane protein beta-barrel domain